MRLALAIGFLAFLNPAVRVQFSDRTDDAGFEVVTWSGGAEKNHILESAGNGVVLVDYDADGFLDVYFVNAMRLLPGRVAEPHSNTLYRNRGDGTFADVTREAGVGSSAFGVGGAAADYDNDGLVDLYVTNFGPNSLFRNNGDGTFRDVSSTAGVDDPRWSIGATFFDPDEDGDADLFVANYIETDWADVWDARRVRLWRGRVQVLDGPRGLRGSRNTYYRNDGDGTFTDATEASGFLPGASSYTMGATSFDYDNDGDVDLYAANDSMPNSLYRNRGDGTFEEVGALLGAAYNADGATQGSMGVDFGDFDNDGLFDVIVTNFAHDYDTLYRNLGGHFTDHSFVSGIAVPSFAPLGWGVHFLDADHDRDLDLFMSYGHIYPQVKEDPVLHETFLQRDLLLLNEGGEFRDVSASAGSGFQILESSRGSAAGDLDNDLDLDIVVSNQDARPSYLVNETEGLGHSVLVQLVDTRGTREALGARLEVLAGGVIQIREISSGGSYASQNDFRAHFGLGEGALIERLTIRWLDGEKETHESLPADRWYLLRRGALPEAVSSR
ncbi:MAG: CRTAC1 family protein [Vicinamibacteria bacterium]